MPAKLPDGVIQPPDRKLNDMQIAETSYISSMFLEVAEGGELYVRPNTILTKRWSRAVQVDRLEDGFHVVLIAKGIRWQTTKLIERDAIPVASVREQYDPELDQEAQDAALKALVEKAKNLGKREKDLDQGREEQA
jgi:hypothetical protein